MKTLPKTTLSRIQTKVWLSEARFRVLVWGRRSGKSHLAKLWLLNGALTRPGTDNWFVSTTQRNVKKHHFGGPGDIRRIVPARYIQHVNQVDMILTLHNESRILLGGRENADNMRGGGVYRLVNDEFAVQENAADRGLETWEEVLLPMMAEFDGQAILSTTPKGFNFGYDFYVRGQDPEFPSWESWQCTTIESGRFTSDRLKDIKSAMDPRSYRQEFEASFETMSGRVYYTFNRTKNVDADVQDTGAELYVGQDFNVHPMASAIAVKVADEIHFIADLELSASNTEEVAAELKQRYPDRKIIMCPDPSGSARKTSAPVGQTDFTILKNAGFEVRAPRAAPLVVDRENNTNANLCAADGKVRVKIHPRCVKLIRAWEGLTYKEGTSQRDKGSGLDHMCDAADYLLWQESNLVEKKRKLRLGEFSI